MSEKFVRLLKIVAANGALKTACTIVEMSLFRKIEPV